MFFSLCSIMQHLLREIRRRLNSPALSRLIFLASKMKAQERAAASAVNSTDGAVTQLARYVTDAAEAGAVDALDFWSSRRATYSTLLPLAEDLLAAPASQAYVERVFSLCGLLTAGRPTG